MELPANCVLASSFFTAVVMAVEAVLVVEVEAAVVVDEEDSDVVAAEAVEVEVMAARTSIFAYLYRSPSAATKTWFSWTPTNSKSSWLTREVFTYKLELRWAFPILQSNADCSQSD